MKRLATLFLTVLLACSGSEPTYPSLKAIEGTWILQSVNQSPLPVTTSAGTETLGSTLVASSGSFTISSVVRASGSQAEPKTVVESGNYYCGHVGCRPQLFLFRESGAQADATVDDTTLMLARPDLVLVYKKGARTSALLTDFRR